MALQANATGQDGLVARAKDFGSELSSERQLMLL